MPTARLNSFRKNRPPIWGVGRREAVKSLNSNCKSTDLLYLGEFRLLTLSIFGRYNTRDFVNASLCAVLSCHMFVQLGQ